MPSKPKLSLKLLKDIVSNAEDGITYDQIVEQLDADQCTYNEPMLQGVIMQSLEKGNFIQTNEGEVNKGVFGPKPRTSTGGSTPTKMYQLKKPMKPDAEAYDFTEKPYDKEAVQEEGSTWGTTKLAAVKAAKKQFYRTVYWPALEQYRMIEEEINPSSSGDASADEAAA